jgi:diacylglycerol kinase (ATP)
MPYKKGIAVTDRTGEKVVVHSAECRRRFTVMGRLKSFDYALRGVLLMLKSQHNAWLHAAATLVVVLLGRSCCHLTSGEWCVLVLAIMAVWSAEALNTAFEFLADVASPEFHPLVEKAKDVAAGAVLIAATGSVVIALLVFGPYIKALLQTAANP